MSAENIYDLYMTDKDRNVLVEEKSIDVNAAEKIIRAYPWRDSLPSYAQLWKYNTKFSFSIHYMAATNSFFVGFSDKASHFKLPLPYVGATYGLLDTMDKTIKALYLFFEGEFEKLGQFLATYRPEQTGD
ncbi:MAG: hypothetical protein JRE88_05330 [Deltaproteobacteria bacterium]|jgi:hypothetical protein|nr:hypothetical protein [Deltaproteobacteria bacterium]MBW2516184.1 hypothetical protein [Deltaproteobacteria bacterium]